MRSVAYVFNDRTGLKDNEFVIGLYGRHNDAQAYSTLTPDCIETSRSHTTVLRNKGEHTCENININRGFS